VSAEKDLLVRYVLTLTASLRGPRLHPTLTPEEQADKAFWDAEVQAARAVYEEAVAATWTGAHP